MALMQDERDPFGFNRKLFDPLGTDILGMQNFFGGTPQGTDWVRALTQPNIEELLRRQQLQEPGFDLNAGLGVAGSSGTPSTAFSSTGGSVQPGVANTGLPTNIGQLLEGLLTSGSLNTDAAGSELGAAPAFAPTSLDPNAPLPPSPGLVNQPNQLQFTGTPLQAFRAGLRALGNIPIPPVAMLGRMGASAIDLFGPKAPPPRPLTGNTIIDAMLRGTPILGNILETSDLFSSVPAGTPDKPDAKTAFERMLELEISRMSQPLGQVPGQAFDPFAIDPGWMSALIGAAGNPGNITGFNATPYDVMDMEFGQALAALSNPFSFPGFNLGFEDPFGFGQIGGSEPGLDDPFGGQTADVSFSGYGSEDEGGGGGGGNDNDNADTGDMY